MPLRYNNAYHTLLGTKNLYSIERTLLLRKLERMGEKTLLQAFKCFSTEPLLYSQNVKNTE
jgi:hypothetical protein